MDAEAAQSFVIPLQDGTELHIGAEGARIGARLYELARIQDARQVSPEPETLALRVAGAGLVEFRPARRGDGRLALEALYRLRPDLRPAGFEPPATLPEGFPPLPTTPIARFAAPPGSPPFPSYPTYPNYPGYPPPQGYPPPGYPPYPGYPGYARPGYPPPQGPYGPYPGGVNPNRLTGAVTRYPRRFGEVLGAAFQLFGAHLARWLTLGLLVGVVPGVLGGAVQLVFNDAQPRGLDALPGSTGTSACRYPVLTFPPTGQLLRDGELFVGLLALSLIFSAFEAGVLGGAARDALLGRRVRIGASLANGVRRLPAVLGTTLLQWLLFALLLGPALACFEAALPYLSGLDLCSGNPVLSGQAVTEVVLTVVGAALLLLGGVIFLLVFFRIGAAPYVAATERLGPVAAIRRSWHLTRGFYWRTFGLVALMLVLTALIGLVLSAATSGVDETLAALAIVPLAGVVGAPLLALTWTAHLFDLRLRREGIDTLREGGEAAGDPAGTQTGV